MESEKLKKSNMGGWNIFSIWIYVSEFQIKLEKLHYWLCFEFHLHVKHPVIFSVITFSLIFHFYAHGIIVKGFI